MRARLRSDPRNDHFKSPPVFIHGMDGPISKGCASVEEKTTKRYREEERKKERKKKSFERTRSQMGKVGIVQRRSGHPSQKREDRYSKYATGIYTTDKTCPSCLSISSICLMVHIDQPDTSLLFSSAAAAQLA